MSQGHGDDASGPPPPPPISTLGHRRFPFAWSAYHRVVVSKIRPSRRASSFTESVIREMTRLSVAHGAINLSQGFPDFPAPEEIKEAARQAKEEAWKKNRPRTSSTPESS